MKKGCFWLAREKRKKISFWLVVKSNEFGTKMKKKAATHET